MDKFIKRGRNKISFLFSTRYLGADYMENFNQGVLTGLKKTRTNKWEISAP